MGTAHTNITVDLALSMNVMASVLALLAAAAAET